MHEPIRGLTEAITAVLEANSDTSVSLKYLYSEMMGGELITLPRSATEVTYNQMKFKHSVRGVLKMLEYQGKINRVDRGLYQWIRRSSIQH